MKLTFTVTFASLISFCAFGATAAVIEETVSQKPSVKATSHFLLSQSGDATDKTVPATEMYRHEATVSGEYNPLEANVSFTSRYTPDSIQSQNTAFTLEKKTVTYSGDMLTAKVGDSHQELGKGIALSLYRNPSFGIDNTLEGGATKLNFDAGEAGLFAGRVNAWKVPIAINPVDQNMKGRNVYLAAGHAAVNVTSDAKLGAHYLLTQNEEVAQQFFSKRQQTIGSHLTLSNIADEVDLYLEGNALVTDNYETNEARATGYGSYASLTWSPSAVKLKAEAKDYRGFSYEFRRPPTLEEDIIPSANYDDVTAGRVTADVQIGNPSDILTTSFLTGYDREADSQIYHPIMGTRYELSKTLTLDVRGGYRWMPNTSSLSHAALKTKVKTGKGQYFEFEVRKQISNDALSTGLPDRKDRNIFLANYTFNERWSAGTGYEFIPSNTTDTGNHFVNFSGSYKNGAFNGRTLIGQTSGGTQCSGGVCRQVPPFTGAYLETTYAF